MRRERDANLSIEPVKPRLTVEAARDMVRWEEDAFQEELEQRSIDSHYAEATATQLLDMWESDRNEHGKALSAFEWKALCSALLQTFGAIPLQPDRSKRAALPTTATADDTMLDIGEVARMTGLSERTIHRKVQSSEFPKPLRPSERRIVWPASEVKAFVAKLELARRASRR